MTTIEAVLFVIAGGSSRSPNSTSASLIFRGMGADIHIYIYICICPQTKKERKCPYKSDMMMCAPKDAVQAVACECNEEMSPESPRKNAGRARGDE